MNSITNIAESFVSLLYPHSCVCCNRTLTYFEKHVCRYCMSHLPRTHFDKLDLNPVMELLIGRIPLKRASSFLIFNRRNSTRKILHELKYRENPELGYFIGQKFITEVPAILQEIDAILPVPLHHSKLKKRGYNQSEEFARGIAYDSFIPILNGAAVRIKESVSQTKKGKMERIKTLQDAFSVNDSIHDHQHILIVDDVITTGSTLETLVLKVLEQNPTIQLSFASIAYAQR